MNAFALSYNVDGARLSAAPVLGDANVSGDFWQNLVRNELSPAERAMHVAERKRLYEEMHPETKNGGDRKTSKSVRQVGDLNRFTADVAEKTGKSERKRLYEEMHPETKHGGDRKKSSRQVVDLAGDRFTTDAAEKTGKSERSIQRDASRGHAPHLHLRLVPRLPEAVVQVHLR